MEDRKGDKQRKVWMKGRKEGLVKKRGKEDEEGRRTGRVASQKPRRKEPNEGVAAAV